MEQAVVWEHLCASFFLKKKSAATFEVNDELEAVVDSSFRWDGPHQLRVEIDADKHLLLPVNQGGLFVVYSEN